VAGASRWRAEAFRRTKVKRAFVASLVVVAALGTLARGDAEQDRKDMQGTWLLESAQLGGQKYPEKLLKTMKLVLKDHGYTVTVGDQSDEGTVMLDPDKTPKAMDITGTNGPNKGKTILAIYELNGDTLRVCYDLSGEARPSEFEARPNTPLFLVHYKREKP
jgi:uncharacterized protein (TIGR03067 family)